MVILNEYFYGVYNHGIFITAIAFLWHYLVIARHFLNISRKMALVVRAIYGEIQEILLSSLEYL